MNKNQSQCSLFLNLVRTRNNLDDGDAAAGKNNKWKGIYILCLRFSISLIITIIEYIEAHLHIQKNIHAALPPPPSQDRMKGSLLQRKSREEKKSHLVRFFHT